MLYKSESMLVRRHNSGSHFDYMTTAKVKPKSFGMISRTVVGCQLEGSALRTLMIPDHEGGLGWVDPSPTRSLAYLAVYPLGAIQWTARCR
jgi:hypothetical protein